MNTIDILKGAKQLLIDKGWTQGQYGLAENGAPLLVGDDFSTQAVCFCGWGAIAAVCGDFDMACPIMDILSTTVQPDEDGKRHFPTFNDAPGRTVDEVLAKFDEAIAAEEAKAQG